MILYKGSSLNNLHAKYFLDKNILICGGSFGIGEEICRQLAEYKANLIITARSIEKLNKLSMELPIKNYVKKCDFSKKTELDNLYKFVSNKWQKIDLVIFCLGIYQPMSLENFDLKIAKKIMDVNFNSCLNFIGVFLPFFQGMKIKQFSVISSSAGYFGMPNSMAYGASKAVLSNLVESLYYELQKYDTKVQLINPGFVKTRLTAKNNFKMPFIIDVNKAVKIIIKNLSSSKFEVFFPLFLVGLMKIIKNLPYKIRMLIIKKLK